MEEIKQSLDKVRKSSRVLEEQLQSGGQGIASIDRLHKHLSILHSEVENLKEDVIQSENCPIRYQK